MAGVKKAVQTEAAQAAKFDFTKFPEELRAKLEGIAASEGDKGILDTQQEIYDAAKALKDLEQKKSGVMIGGQILNLGDFKFSVVPGENGYFSNTYPHILLRLNKGTEEKIYQAVTECGEAYGRIRQLASDGKRVFVVLDGVTWSIGHLQNVGIVATDENQNSKLFFLDLSTEETIGGFKYRDGKLYLETWTATGETREYDAATLAALPKKTHFRSCPRP